MKDVRDDRSQWRNLSDNHVIYIAERYVTANLDSELWTRELDPTTRSSVTESSECSEVAQLATSQFGTTKSSSDDCFSNG